MHQIHVTGDYEAAEEVVPEEAVTKNVAEEADDTTAHNTHHQSGTSREKWRILAQF